MPVMASSGSGFVMSIGPSAQQGNYQFTPTALWQDRVWHHHRGGNTCLLHLELAWNLDIGYIFPSIAIGCVAELQSKAAI